MHSRGKDWLANAAATAERMHRQDISELTALLFPEGRLVIRPAAEIQAFGPLALRQLCVEQGIYMVPTLELVEYLRGAIGPVSTILSRKCIEIGAGNGVLAEALGIAATDSRMQERPDIAKHYQTMRQTVVPYGDNVKTLDAAQAVARFRPHTVLGCWVTHKWDPRKHQLGGNEVGIDERALLKQVRRYIMIGNDKTHANKPLLNKPHQTIRANWLLSRAEFPELNAIYIWKGGKR